jgi:hypothetical protein
MGGEYGMHETSEKHVEANQLCLLLDRVQFFRLQIITRACVLHVRPMLRPSSGVSSAKIENES